MATSSETLRSLASRLARADARVAIDLHVLELLDVPDTHAAREAERICREVSSESLANHCFRSYAWGALLGTKDEIAWDAELFYVAAMLHDLGLTEAYDRGGCFESDGAQAAREILGEVGWPPERAEIAAEAIYLHMHDVGADDRAEAKLLERGTTADVSGGRALEVGDVGRELVLDLFPRLGFKEHFIALFEDQARRKPSCVVHRYVHELAVAERIRAAPYDD